MGQKIIRQASPTTIIVTKQKENKMDTQRDSTIPPSETERQIHEIDLSAISTDPNQPRDQLDKEALKELANSPLHNMAYCSPYWSGKRVKRSSLWRVNGDTRQPKKLA